MAQRTLALCNNEYIGIESIYKVNPLGERIYLEDKLTEVRNLSQEGKLFCPCGCGVNLVLVAGKNMKREQHFRIKDGSDENGCTYVAEGLTSVNSKIDLNNWLMSKVNLSDIEQRVHQKDVDKETERRFELTFLSRKHRLALCYWKDFNNLSEEKLKNIQDLAKHIKIYYIVDESNSLNNGQFPEAMMKVQKIQGYCLFLECKGENYNNTILRAAFYMENSQERWEEVTFAKNKLDNWTINSENELVVGDATLYNMLAYKKSQFEKQVSKEKEQLRKEAEEKRLREEKEALEIAKREQERLLQEEKRLRLAQEEAQKKYQRQKEEATRLAEIQSKFYKRDYDGAFDQNDTIVKDRAGNRLIRCKICQKIGRTDEFAQYGGSGSLNLGICDECNRARSRKR